LAVAIYSVTVFGAGYLIFWLLAWIWVNPPLPKLLQNFLELVLLTARPYNFAYCYT
jgi:hypothetical protein